MTPTPVEMPCGTASKFALSMPRPEITTSFGFSVAPRRTTFVTGLLIASVLVS